MSLESSICSLLLGMPLIKSLEISGNYFGIHLLIKDNDSVISSSYHMSETMIENPGILIAHLSHNIFKDIKRRKILEQIFSSQYQVELNLMCSEFIPIDNIVYPGYGILLENNGKFLFTIIPEEPILQWNIFKNEIISQINTPIVGPIHFHHFKNRRLNFSLEEIHSVGFIEEWVKILIHDFSYPLTLDMITIFLKWKHLLSNDLQYSFRKRILSWSPTGIKDLYNFYCLSSNFVTHHLYQQFISLGKIRLDNNNNKIFSESEILLASIGYKMELEPKIKYSLKRLEKISRTSAFFQTHLEETKYTIWIIRILKREKYGIVGKKRFYAKIIHKIILQLMNIAHPFWDTSYLVRLFSILYSLNSLFNVDKLKEKLFSLYTTLFQRVNPNGILQNLNTNENLDSTIELLDTLSQFARW